MSELDRFFETCGEIETEEAAFGDLRFLIRRIDGVQAMELANIESETERVLYVLAECALDPETKEAIGRVNAEKLLRGAESVALKLAGQVYEFSSRVLEEFEERWNIAKKK